LLRSRRPAPVPLSFDSALNTLSLRPVTSDCSALRDLALCASSRIAPLPCVSRSLPPVDRSPCGSWRSVQVYGLLRTLARLALVLLTDHSVLNTLKLRPVRGSLRARHLACRVAGCELLRFPPSSRPAVACGFLRSCRLEPGIKPGVQSTSCSTLPLRSVWRLLSA
jgi:hypothetical protein